MTIGPDPDRHMAKFKDWNRAIIGSYFGPEIAEEIGAAPLINCGVFAATAASRLWAVWDEAMEAALALVRRTNFLRSNAPLTWRCGRAACHSPTSRPGAIGLATGPGP